jgi:glycosyltransferase involved in cell wall biosynthesis
MPIPEANAPVSVRVSVIIPIYNELRFAEEVIRRVIAAPLPSGCEKEIIVVDDGSTDGTVNLLRRLRAEGKIRCHESILNFGKGTAIRIGLKLATGQIILVQDGDLEYDPGEYALLLRPILDGQADVVYGSRFAGSIRGMRGINWLANRLLTLAANLLYGAGISDEATAYKVFRRTVLDRIQLECKRFEFCPEVTAKVRRLGVNIHEVPITYNARGLDQGKKIRWRDGVEAMYTLLRYRFARIPAAPLPAGLRNQSAHW